MSEQHPKSDSSAVAPSTPSTTPVPTATTTTGPASRPVMCDVADSVLQCRTDFGDRFVFSKQFIPLRLALDDSTPLVTFYQKQSIQDHLARHHEALGGAVESREVRDLLDRAGIKVPAHEERAPGHDPLARTFGQLDAEHDEIRRQRIDRGVDEVHELMRLARGAESAAASRELSSLIDAKLGELTAEQRDLRGSASADATVARGGRAAHAPTKSIVATTTATPDPIDVLINLLKSDFGYLFLDRTRIRPSGFSVGEHIYALSLAPGEEVVLEQKTFSKRQVTYEEQTEEEKQQELELSSTLSTELQEGVERQNNRSNSSGFTAGGTLGVKEGADVSANVGYSTNLTDAHNETRTRSVKDNTSSTQRVAAKYRAAHKVSFRVSSEEGFEASSKRVLRNPNRFTPVNLHYFKIMQVLELSQERYGVRLGWAPTIKDPGFDFYERIRTGRESILATAEHISLPPRPTPPPKADKPPKVAYSALTPADKWGALCDMRYDYPLEIQVPDGYIWDGNVATVSNSLTMSMVDISRSAGAYVLGTPIVIGDKLTVTVHVGVDWKRGFGCGTIELQVSANFVADPNAADPAYQAAYAQYLSDLATWETNTAAKLDAAREEARKKADDWEHEMLRTVNPLGELMNRVISHEFLPATRDEAWEIELWQQIFDWGAASFVLYPAWWSDLPMRDPLRSPTDFFNASWARLYVPIRIGFERMALRWLFGKQVQTPLSPAYETAFTKLETELKDFRKANFGDERETGLEPAGAGCAPWKEKFLCLARWNELLPTDGTHLEVVQSATSAADQYSRAEVDALRAAQQASLDGALQDVELRKKGLAGMKKEIDSDVHIVVGEGGGA